MIYIPFLTELREIAQALNRAYPDQVIQPAEPTEAISYVDDLVIARQQLREQMEQEGRLAPQSEEDEAEAAEELIDRPHLV